MKRTFPWFVTSLQCDCTKQQVIDRIEKAVACKSNNLEILQKNEALILQANAGSYMYFNSFMPIITVDIASKENQSFIRITFKLKKSVRAMLVFLTVFALFFEALILYFALTSQLTTYLLLFLPVGFLIFIFLLSIFGLYFSSKSVSGILSEALNGEA